MKKVPILEAELTMHQFATTKKVFAAHELPLYLAKWGNGKLEVQGKTGRYHEIEDMPSEIQRLVAFHGNDRMVDAFGTGFAEVVELAVDKIAEKEKDIDGSENTAKSKNRTSAETRV